MADNKGFIKSHETLRVPDGWTNTERALVIQLERIHDDIYKYFGRLKMSDLGEELRGMLVTGIVFDAQTNQIVITVNGESSNLVKVATLDTGGRIPAAQLPSYVDDVEEYATSSAFPATGEQDKIYVARDTGFTYRWSGTQYVRLNTYDEATQSASGLMSAADKTKLDGVAEGATANVGTITGITMNGASKGTSGVVDLGTVIISHQDISGKADKSTTVTAVGYDSTNKKITRTINGAAADVVSVATMKSAMAPFTWGALKGS